MIINALAIILLAIAVALMLWPRLCPAVIPAYAGMLLLHYSTAIYLPRHTIVFWGVAAAIVVALNVLQPKGEPDGCGASNRYIGLSAIAGALVGLAINPRILIASVIVGALLGLLAYSRTPRGRWLKFPSGSFWTYAAHKALPVVVNSGILALSLQGYIGA